MESSKQKSNFFDPYRQQLVLATPEEIVRQKLLQLMTTQLGYPRQLVSVEKSLKEFPHLQRKGQLPSRRADIVCFAKGIHPEFSLYPLLLIECKEGKVGGDAASQALGYNYYLQAPYVAIAGEDEVFLIHPQKLSFLPTYRELVEKICN